MEYPKNVQPCGLAARLGTGIIIRRSGVRIPEAPPIKSRGYVEKRDPFCFSKYRISEGFLIFRSALAMAVCCLSACGGGGVGIDPAAEKTTEAATPASPTSCVPVPVRIQLFGDSTQFGDDPLTSRRTDVYPENALQPLMDARFGAGSVIVSTRAAGGTTSTQLVAGTDGVNRPWPQSVAAEIVVINHGINDPLHGVTEPQFTANLQALITAPAIVVLQTPLPSNLILAGAKDYAPLVRAVADASKIPLIDSAAFAAATPNWFRLYSLDGVHPNSSGYTLLAGVQFQVLEPLVAKLRCR